MTGVVHVKDSGSWKCVNFGGQHIWVNHSGTWKDPIGAYVKDGGTWKLVYPSLTETWTTAGYGDLIDIGNDGVSPTVDVASTPLSNVTTGAYIQWHTGSGLGEWISVADFDWTPTTSAGFSYGAVSRVEVSFQAQCSSGTHYVKAGPQHATLKTTAALGTSWTTYTMDYTVAGWVLTDDEAGDLHLTPSHTDSIKIQPLQGTSGIVYVKEIKARIKYYSN
jgi:hypothetical protein